MSVEMADIRNGLATNLKTVGTSRQVLAYPTDNQVPPTLLVVGFDKITRTGFGNPGSGRGSYEIPFIVQGIAGKPTTKSAHIVLDKWLSPLASVNVWGAIESDRTLGGKVSSLSVVECDGYQEILLPGGVTMLGSTWHINIEL
jgi:hypothetical protein